MRSILFNSLALIILANVMVTAAIINIPSDYPTIQQGINASYNGDTVLVQPGYYEENINFNGHNIVVGSLYLTTGDTSYISQTQIDGGHANSVVIFDNAEDSTAALIGFMIMNGYAEVGGGIRCTGADPLVAYNIISNNSVYADGDGFGGGVYCIYSNMKLLGNLIINNVATGPLGGNGGGIYCGYLTPIIKGNQIINNLGDWTGGGVYFDYCNAIFSQNILANNTATAYGGGILCESSNPIMRNVTSVYNHSSWGVGGGMFSEASYPVIVNSIFWGDSSYYVPDEIYYETGHPMVSYTNIYGGWYEGEGNTWVEPYFRNPDQRDFHLMAVECDDPYDSPCIDMGNPAILDSILDCDWGLGDSISDMGAYGGWDSIAVGIDKPEDAIPGRYNLSQNYPNPFNASTIIKYQIPRESHVEITIFDILGRRVAVLEEGLKQAGYHQVVWHADDIASGVYLYKIQAGEYINTRQMLLVK
jgi:hypothetical protein